MRNSPPENPRPDLVDLIERIRPRFDREGVAGLNEFEHTLLALYELDSEVCNGGFGQWLYQAPRELVRTAPECLERFGDEHGHVLNLVRCLFHDIDPDAFDLDWEAWEEYLEDRGDWFWNRINAYDLAFGAVERFFIERVWDYAARHCRDVRGS